MADNLTYDSIVTSIKENKIKNLYLFYGSEALLMNDALARLEKRVINPDFKSLNYSKLDGAEISYDEIVNACETLPFMDEKRMVVVHNCSFFKSRKQKKEDGKEENQIEELCTYLSHAPETTVLVLTGGKEIDKKRKIYNCIKKHGDIVEFGLLKGNELNKWIVKEFDKLHKTISKADIAYLVDRIPEGLSDILNEIKKLSSYVGNKAEVTKSDIDVVVAKSLENNVFQLVDSIAVKNPGKALIILNELIVEAQPIALILAMIIRQYRMLFNIKLMSGKGYSTGEISQKLGLNTYVLNNLQKISSNYSEEQIIKRLKRCLEADVSIKTGKMDERTAVEYLIIEFAK